MTLIDTLDYFITDTEYHLECFELDISELTNYQCGDWDRYRERYDLAKQRLDDLKQIKTILEKNKDD